MDLALNEEHVGGNVVGLAKRMFLEPMSCRLTRATRRGMKPIYRNGKRGIGASCSRVR